MRPRATEAESLSRWRQFAEAALPAPRTENGTGFYLMAGLYRDERQTRHSLEQDLDQHLDVARLNPSSLNTCSARASPLERGA